jgi:membrane-bound lytic murein transglycosylase A
MKMEKAGDSFRKPFRVCPILLFILFFAGCHPTLPKEVLRAEEALVRVRFFYPEFKDDMDLASLESAVNHSLAYLNRLDPERLFEYGEERYPCRYVVESQKALLDLIRNCRSPEELNRAVRKGFVLYKAKGRLQDPKVLFTGYYEPTYEANLYPDDLYRYPIYKRPDDLLQIDLSPFKEDFKGKSIVARIEGKKVVPYYSRKDIETSKALAGRKLELAWLKDPLDVSFLQIQGSGRLKLPDNSIIRVGYEASNGRPYQSIGRYLLDRGLLSREEVSMQSIRRYLTDHRDVQEEVLNHNPSYVFFRASSGGPYGNINVPLTPGRSLALDSRLFPRGALCFVMTRKPVLDSENRITDWKEFSRFMLNQDTGGAIKGAGRADLFWGNDEYAETAAGHMKHEGDLYVLIKRPEPPGLLFRMVDFFRG